ncbi:MAG: permease-like cell division protein FtsX [Actinomycetota bacterium]
MRLHYFFSETVTNLRRNLLMTVAAISTVAISLLLLGGFVILDMIVDNVTLNLEGKVEISAYLHENAAEGEIQALQEEVSGYPEVRSVDYKSQSEAYAEFKRLYRNQPEFYEHLEADDLPASLEIKTTSAELTQDVADRIEGAPGVDDVRYGGQIIDRLLRVNALIRTITLVMSVILMVAAAALISNTIRLAIYARREEIGIMKLVGATNWFIRVPFMFEGVFASLVGALIAGSIVAGANFLVFRNMGTALPFLGPVFTFTNSEIGFVLLAWMLVPAALVGLLTSFVAVHRFLEV